ncbi:HesA/MoeB/ThiF family protein [Alicyclobacillus hesperidum]|uniref:HesA/MoeB/ThiF family protein n=1 Tax=Alicyclobacillus hesperidum TaxID=89784 RepID=UPI0023EA537C|nr:ThiF family adenylyltransferase [Alicyclobacillus hesperidum]
MESRIVRIEDSSTLAEIITGADLVIKAIDSPESVMTWLNQACVAQGIPYIAGGFADTSGIIGPIFIPKKSLCFDCVGAPQGKRLAGIGPTLSPVVGAVASQIALYAVKILWHSDADLVNKLFTYRFDSSSWHESQLESTKTCSTCGHPPYAPRRKLIINWPTVAIFVASSFATLLEHVKHTFFWGLCGLLVLFFITGIYAYRRSFVQTFRRLVVDGAVFVLPAIVGTDFSTFKAFSQHFSAATILNIIQTILMIIAESAIAYTVILVVITGVAYLAHFLHLPKKSSIRTNNT